MCDKSEDHCPICSRDLNEGPCEHLVACWDSLSDYPDGGGSLSEFGILEPLNAALYELNEQLEEANAERRDMVLSELANSGVIPAPFLKEVRARAWPGIGYFEKLIVDAIESAPGFVSHTSFTIDRGPGFSEEVNSWFARDSEICRAVVRSMIEPVMKQISQSLDS